MVEEDTFTENMSLRFTCDSEASASESLDNSEDMCSVCMLDLAHVASTLNGRCIILLVYSLFIISSYKF